MKSLSNYEILRYNRQISLKDFGIDGQTALKNAKVLVLGVGGLGSTVLLNLAYCGFGHIKFVDKDSVDVPNLNRQFLHWEEDVGKPKVLSAYKKLSKINSNTEFLPIFGSISEEMIFDLVKEVDLIIDCLDSFKVRAIVNKVSLETKVPFIHGGVGEFCGQVTTIVPGDSPCLICLIGEEFEDKKGIPIISPVCGIVGSLQVSEAIKIVTGKGEALLGKLFCIDLKDSSFRILNFQKDPFCPACGIKKTSL